MTAQQVRLLAVGDHIKYHSWAGTWAIYRLHTKTMPEFHGGGVIGGALLPNASQPGCTFTPYYHIYVDDGALSYVDWVEEFVDD